MTDKSNPLSKFHRDIGREAIRWIGFFAGMTLGIIVLLFPKNWVGSEPNSRDILLTLGLMVLPAFASAVISLARLYWVLILPGIWFVGWGFALRLETHPPGWSLVFLVVAVLLLVAPFLAWGLNGKSKLEKGQPAAPGDEDKSRT